jgi:hypothetical protein
MLYLRMGTSHTDEKDASTLYPMTKYLIAGIGLLVVEKGLYCSFCTNMDTGYTH